MQMVMSIFTVLAFGLMLCYGSGVQQEKRLTAIVAEELGGVDSNTYIKMVDSIEQAFELGASPQGRMQVLKASLLNSTISTTYFVAEDATGLDHNSAVYGYFKVTYGYKTYSVKIVSPN